MNSIAYLMRPHPENRLRNHCCWRCHNLFGTLGVTGPLRAVQQHISCTAPESGAAEDVQQHISSTAPESGAAVQQHISCTAHEFGAAGQQHISCTAHESGAAMQQHSSCTAPESGAAMQQHSSCRAPESCAVVLQHVSCTAPESAAEAVLLKPCCNTSASLHPSPVQLQYIRLHVLTVHQKYIAMEQRYRSLKKNYNKKLQTSFGFVKT